MQLPRTTLNAEGETVSRNPRINRLKISAFRGIRSADIKLDRVLALVGQNGSGKTSVLTALNCFFNFDSEQTSLEDGRHQFSKNRQSVIEVEFENLPKQFLNEFGINPERQILRLKFKRRAVWEAWDGQSFVVRDAAMVIRLRDHVRFYYVPTRRDFEVASGGGTDALVRRIVREWVEKNLKRDIYSVRLSAVADTFKSNVISQVERRINGKAAHLNEHQFTVGFEKNLSVDHLIDSVGLYLRESDTSWDLRETGSGTQSIAVVRIVSALANLEGATYILGFEEPEQNLHPQAQRQLINGLLKSESTQLIVTTHSPVIVDAIDHTDVALCHRVKESKTGWVIHEIRQLSPTFYKDHGLDEVSYTKFHARRNSEFMFANSVILVEGDTDSDIVRLVLKKSGVDPDDYGCSIIPVGGVNNFASMYYIATNLGIPCYSIFDRDYLTPYQTRQIRSEDGQVKSEICRDSSGYPRYKNTLNSNCIFVTAYANKFDEAGLLQNLNGRHSDVLDILGEFNFLVMRYNLEADLVGSRAARLKFAQILGLPLDSTSSSFLTENAKKIKRVEVIHEVVDSLRRSNYPHSYSRIAQVVSRFILDSSM